MVPMFTCGLLRSNFALLIFCSLQDVSLCLYFRSGDQDRTDDLPIMSRML
jgi:hypothetical protein